MIKWLLIESAPKDGTQIIVKNPTKRGFTITRVYWKADGWFKWSAPHHYVESPSHWLPIGHHPLKGVCSAEFLTWFERACFFRDDAYREMMSLGVDADTCFILTRCEAFREKHSIVQMYQDYGRSEPYKSALDKWVAFKYEKYQAIIARNKNET